MRWSTMQIFETRIRRNIRLAESPSFGQTVLAYESTSNGATDYRALAMEVIEMGKNIHTPEATNHPASPTPAVPREA